MPAMDVRTILYPVKIMITANKRATAPSTHKVLVKYININPAKMPIVEYVSVFKCFPSAINGSELFFFPVLSQIIPAT